MRQRILFVNDGVLNQKLRAAFAERRLEIIESDAEHALARLANEVFELVLIQLRNATEAVDLLRSVHADARLRNLRTLVIAEWGSGQPMLALSQGADVFEPAPIDAPRLIESVEKLLRPRMVMTARASTADGEIEG